MRVEERAAARRHLQVAVRDAEEDRAEERDQPAPRPEPAGHRVGVRALVGLELLEEREDREVLGVERVLDGQEAAVLGVEEEHEAQEDGEQPLVEVVAARGRARRRGGRGRRARRPPRSRAAESGAPRTPGSASSFVTFAWRLRLSARMRRERPLSATPKKRLAESSMTKASRMGRPPTLAMSSMRNVIAPDDSPCGA